MRRWAFFFILLLACNPLWAAAWTSQRTGLWSRTSDNADSPWHDGGAQTALAAVPANTDTVTIANTHDVEFDVDQSGFAAGITLTIAAGGTLHASTTAGSYYLKLQNTDMALAGTLRAGTSTSVPYPSTCTFTIDHNNNAKSIEVSTTGHLYLYCTQPTNRYIYTNAASTGWDAMDQIKVATDVTGDGPWNIAGAQIQIVDSTPLDSEIRTLSSVAADELTVSAVVTNAKSDDSLIVLVTRNVRIINVAASDYAITYASGAGGGDHIGSEIDNCYRGINGGTGFEFAGTMALLAAGPTGINLSTGVTISGTITLPGAGTIMSSANGASVSGLLAGGTNGIQSARNISISGLIFGCTSGTNTVTGMVVTSAGGLLCNTQALNVVSGATVYGSLTGSVNQAIVDGTDIRLAGADLGVSSVANIRRAGNGVAYNTIFGGGTEFSEYDDEIYRAPSNYFESFDHNQIVNAFRAWCLGGVVTSQTVSPPTGYSVWYELAAEDITQTYPVFRQYETTVLPGTAIEVIGQIRIADGEDLSTSDKEPQLQIIDKFADPLVDDTQSPLDYDIPADVTGATTGWQDVSVLWANQGDSPRQVIVRMIAYNDGGADAVYVDTVWAIADYQTQIATAFSTLIPLRTTVATANTAASFTLTAGVATADAYNNMALMVKDADDGHWELRSISDWTVGRVITVDTAYSFTPAAGDAAYLMATVYGAPVDLTPITAKLPTNYIMGSSDQTDKDDEIDAILADTGELQTDWTDGGRLDLLLDAVKAMTDLMSVNTTTIATVTDANEFTITAGEDVNDAYAYHAIMVEDATDSHAEVRWIEEYVTSRSVFVDEPFSFEPAPGDNVWILGTTYGGFLQQILSAMRNASVPVFYFKNTGGGATEGAGGTTYYDQSGSDP